MTTLVLLATDALETTTFAPRRVVWVSADIILVSLCVRVKVKHIYLIRDEKKPITSQKLHRTKKRKTSREEKNPREVNFHLKKTKKKR